MRLNWKSCSKSRCKIRNFLADAEIKMSQVECLNFIMRQKLTLLIENLFILLQKEV